MLVVAPVDVLLGLLAQGSRHGYDLKREHDERFPHARPLAFGQVYATLGRLERDGLVAVARTGRDGGPERTEYALTSSGRSHLQRWLCDVVPPAPYVSTELFAKVVLALLTARGTGSGGGGGGDSDTSSGAGTGTEAAVRYLAAQRQAHLARMRELTAAKTAPGASLADVLTADHALAHLDADLRWMASALARIDALRREVLP